MGFGLKKRLFNVAASAFDLEIFWKGERHHWPERDYVIRLFDYLDIGSVLDVGANRGQYGKWLRTIGYTGEIISFEPRPHAFEILSAEAAQDKQWTCYPWALGRERGKLQLNQMASDDFSSFRQPAATGLYHSENTIVGTIEAEVETLDNAASMASQRAFLKLDTQGFDLEVVAGGRTVIRNFAGVSSEVSLKRLYCNTPGIEESVATFEELGFSPSRMFPVHPAEMFNLFEMNAYFVNGDYLNK